MSAPIEISSILAAVSELETRLAALRHMLEPTAESASGGKRGRPAKKQRKPRDPDAPKREPNDWIKFTVRVRTLLAEREQKFKMAKHTLAFAKYLRTLKGEVTDEVILTQRATWQPPADDAKSESSSTAELREELRTVGKAALEAGADVDAALAEAAAAAVAKKTEGAASDSEGEGGKKKAGRPKMTEEQKAAAKAARAAKKAPAAGGAAE